MAANWPISEALLGGTRAMRAAGATFLPKWPNEEAESYSTRLNVATLFPALSRTVSVMTGKPFAKQITLGEDVPENIKAWCDDADQQGNNLHSFSAQVMAESLGYGICGVLVDFPKVEQPEGRTLTQQEEASIGVRPYLVFIQHAQILGWQSQRADGVTRLTQLRIAETAEVPDGEFGTALVNRVRVLTPGAYQLWQEGEKGEYALIEGGPTTLDVIPFVPFYGKKLGFMCGISPLLDLAYLNVKHWQSQSDQDTILHVARVPILAMIGAEDGTALTVGASSAVKLPLGAELKFVEHTGAAIAAGEISLEKLEDQMITTGAELLVIKPGEQKSATQSNNEAEANKSDLQRIVESFEDSLDQVLQLMAMWSKQEQGGHASLFKDFGAATLTDASAQLVLSLQQAGLLTKATTLKEQQRRGMLAADIDPEVELAAVEEEGPMLGTIGELDANGDPVDPAEEPGPNPPPGPGNVATPPTPPSGNVATDGGATQTQPAAEPLDGEAVRLMIAEEFKALRPMVLQAISPVTDAVNDVVGQVKAVIASVTVIGEDLRALKTTVDSNHEGHVASIKLARSEIEEVVDVLDSVRRDQRLATEQQKQDSYSTKAQIDAVSTDIKKVDEKCESSAAQLRNLKDDADAQRIDRERVEATQKLPIVFENDDSGAPIAAYRQGAPETRVTFKQA